MEAQSKPVRVTGKDMKKGKAMNELRQAIWEIHQFMPIKAIQQYVDSVYREIKDDD